jgi:uncharacterized FlaG/YvyC family protein
MSDNSVSSINSINLQNGQVSQAAQNQPAGQAALAQPNQASGQPTPVVKDPVSTPKSVDAAQKEAATVEAKAKTESKPISQAQIPLVSRETNLKFQVDEKTHEVTIMIMDRATNKVITTIPPDKIKDVPPGDLLQYLA